MSFDQEELLKELGDARKLLVAARAVMRRKSGLARSAEAVICEIDEFALVLTGRRDYFHAATHAALMRADPPSA